jgi:hypothetical protein
MQDRGDAEDANADAAMQQEMAMLRLGGSEDMDEDIKLMEESMEVELQEEEENRKKREKQRLAGNLAVNAVLIPVVGMQILMSFGCLLESNSRRLGNCHGDRKHAMEFVHSWSDAIFERMFRLAREDFFELLAKIAHKLEKNEEMARRSSGSAISPEMRLLITLRILAGAAYLDMIWYRVNVDHVHELCWEVIQVINNTIENIRWPNTLEDYNRIAIGWQEKQIARWKHDLTPGTIAAGDGLAIPILQPTLKQLRGTQVTNYLNRKSFWALIAQAFCDSNCHFLFFACSWPGATNDVTAYAQTELYRLILSGDYPAWIHLVLDDAYKPFGGIHLTPYSREHLTKLKREGQTDPLKHQEYLMKCGFNHILSSQRITIERAFGQLVRRWGILWKAIEFGLDKVPVIVIVAAKLHNICVDRWIKRGKTQMEIPDHMQLEWSDPDDLEIKTRLNNEFLGDSVANASTKTQARDFLCQKIWDAGVRFDGSDNNFLN